MTHYDRTLTPENKLLKILRSIGEMTLKLFV
jgi:hypothetical protein